MIRAMAEWRNPDWGNRVESGGKARIFPRPFPLNVESRLFSSLSPQRQSEWNRQGPLQVAADFDGVFNLCTPSTTTTFLFS